LKEATQQAVRDILPAVSKPNKPPWIATSKEEKRDDKGKTRIDRERERVKKALQCDKESSKDRQEVAARIMILKDWKGTTKHRHISSSSRKTKHGNRSSQLPKTRVARCQKVEKKSKNGGQNIAVVCTPIADIITELTKSQNCSMKTKYMTFYMS
jgi:hypothetical protein